MRGRTVALMPMKAHSERVKAKNFRNFAGRPLYQWVLSMLVSMEEIDAIVINSDARPVLAEHGFGTMALSGKVLLRDRKPELCGDLVSMNRILADDIEHVEAETYVMTHTTNPLLSAGTVRSALERYAAAAGAGTADSLFSVNRVQTRFYRADGSAVNHDPDELIRTQDLEVWFEENSNLYIFNRESFGATGARIGKAPLMFETPRLESLDIDGPEEWVMAEAVAEYLAARGGKASG